jgi:hypothetical protein
MPVATAPAALADLAQLSLPAKAPEKPPPGYNILFIFVDQEHFFDKWPFPAPGREYLKKNGTTFRNHQSASQACSSARSTVYRPDRRSCIEERSAKALQASFCLLRNFLPANV